MTILILITRITTEKEIITKKGNDNKDESK